MTNSLVTFHSIIQAIEIRKTKSLTFKLNNIIFEALANANSVIATSITHIHSYSSSIKKILHHTINITITEVELFAIRCGINQAIQIIDAFHIITITDSIHSVHWIFNPSIHPYQQQSIAILKNLRLFFNKQSSNTIEFWNCPSNTKWFLHASVDYDIKKFNLIPLSISKVLWDFSKKEEYNGIIRNWQMNFQVSNLKGK